MLAPIILPMLLASQPAFEDLDALDARLAAASDRTAVAVDRRIRIARCPEGAEIVPDKSGFLSVHCASKGWRLRVATHGAGAITGNIGPLLVQRGENVKVVIRGHEFTLNYQATALDTGRLGDAVRVRFVARGTMLSGTVSGQGRVDIID